MRMGFVKRIAVAVIGGMIALAGGASADDWHGSGWTATADPEVAAKTVQRLHDQLKTGYEAGDMAAVRSNVRELDGVLGTLVTRTDEWATRAETRNNAVRADELNTELASKLATMPDGTTKALPGNERLANVGDAIKALLKAIMDLVASLIGGASPPSPPPAPPAPGS